MEPPVADARPVTTTHHGRDRRRRLRVAARQGRPGGPGLPRGRERLHPERTAHLPDLRQTIFDEIKARTQETDLSVPTRNRGYWYYGRTFEGREYGASCRVPVARRRRLGSPTARRGVRGRRTGPARRGAAARPQRARRGARLLLPGRRLDQPRRPPAGLLDRHDRRRALHRAGQGPAHRRAAGRRDRGHPRRRHLDPRRRDLYYTTVDETWRADKIWRHRLGTAQADDELVYHEQDGRFWVGVGRTRSDRFLMIAAGSKTTTEYRYLDADRPERGLPGLRAAAGGTGVRPRARRDRRRGRLPGAAQRTQAPTSSSAAAPVAPDPARGVAPADRATTRPCGWRTSTRSPATWSSTSAATGSPSCGSSSSGRTASATTTWSSSTRRSTPSAPAATRVRPSRAVRLGYTTMAMPSSVYDYDVRTRELTLLRRTPVLGGYDPADYEEHRLWATADDGERVPISIVARRGSREATAAGPARSRSCSTATAPTRSRWTRTSRSPGSRCSTAARRSRSRTCAAAARWAGAGTTTASCCQAEHLHRLRRLRPAPRRHGLDHARAADRRGRQRRRPADGRGRQPGAGGVRRHRGRGAVRRQPDHDARRQRCR